MFNMLIATLINDEKIFFYNAPPLPYLFHSSFVYHGLTIDIAAGAFVDQRAIIGVLER